MTLKPRALDLFCGAGGSAKGFQNAGFYVVGVDIKPQPHYCGDEFYRADALEYLTEHGREFDLINSSPPCQFGSEATLISRKYLHHNYIPELRDLLLASQKPYVIENVEGSRKWLINPVMICGSMFGLPIWRHRYFETHPFQLLSPATCNHRRSPISVVINGKTYETINPVLTCGGGDSKKRLGKDRKTIRPRERVAVLRWAMAIDWMTQQELYQSIPPVYLEWIGREAIARLWHATP